jgi:hypothetical protein
MELSANQTIHPSFEQKLPGEPSGEMELSAKQTIPPSFEQKLPGETSGEMVLSTKQTIPPLFEQKNAFPFSKIVCTLTEFYLLLATMLPNVFCKKNIKNLPDVKKFDCYL